MKVQKRARRSSLYGRLTFKQWVIKCDHCQFETLGSNTRKKAKDYYFAHMKKDHADLG